VTELATTFFAVLAQLAPFLLLGFLVAGLLHALVPERLLARAMGGTGLPPILRATLIGIPLPLCSCGVVPVALELGKRGASRGAVTAFLVATPETGVDSILTSAAVLHPVMVVFRPIAAMLTAIVAGLAVERFSAAPARPAASEESCCATTDAAPKKGLRAGFRYAFVDLFDEVGTFLLPALLVTALLTTLIDPGALSQYVSSRWLQMAILLVVGIPIYVCATAATPIAAALIAGGFSPGAALVFLLVGPATNVVTIVAAARMVGRRGALLYVASVAVVSVACGALLDLIFAWISPREVTSLAHDHSHVGWWEWACAGVLLALIARVLLKKLRRRAAPK
jgi:uncharacterized protein